MKKIIYSIICLIFLSLMLCFPKETINGATDGLLLWFQIVLPTLLPFLIMINFIIQTNCLMYISNICGPFFQKVFSVSKNGSFAVLSGLLCGYPLGAKVTADLLKKNQISQNEASYLLSFCNNASPAFITGFVVIRSLQDNSLMLPTILILYLSPFLCSIVFRKTHGIRCKTSQTHNHVSFTLNYNFELFDTCIMNAFEAITKIGGYIILFSILFSYGKACSIGYFISTVEITNGISFLSSQIMSFNNLYVFTLALASFGGLCSVAQTKSMLCDTNLSISLYIIEKLITAGVTSLLALLYVTFIHQ